MAMEMEREPISAAESRIRVPKGPVRPDEMLITPMEEAHTAKFVHGGMVLRSYWAMNVGSPPLARKNKSMMTHRFLEVLGNGRAC